MLAGLASNKTDFVIVTALEIERRAVCDALGFSDDTRVRKDTRVYWHGTLVTCEGDSYSISVAQLPDMANIDSALMVADCIRHWNPQALILTGIAAAASQAVSLGDVIVGVDVAYYERSKVTGETTRPEPKIIPADSVLVSNTMSLPKWTSKIMAKRPDGTRTRPNVFFGVIACGEKVIANAETRDELVSTNRRVYAIEMEGYGFSRAAWSSFDKTRHIVIKAACDKADSSKSDEWHGYAAASAASFVRHFLVDRPIAPAVRSVDYGDLGSKTDGLDQVADNSPKHSTNSFEPPTVAKTLQLSIDQRSTPVVASLSLAPKALVGVFVEPVLSSESEQQEYSTSAIRSGRALEQTRETSQEDAQETLLADILESSRNYLVLGKRESGKTTLLAYLQEKILSDQNPAIPVDNSRPAIPIFMDFRTLPAGKSRFNKAIQHWCSSVGLAPEVVFSELHQGHCVILIDNFVQDNKRGVKALQEFAESFPGNRFIMTGNELSMDELRFRSSPTLGFECTVVHIHSFKRKQIRELIAKWFSDSDDADGEMLLRQVLTSLAALRIPSTPLTISLLLLVLERQPSSYNVPTNKAALVEKLLEYLLEKMSPVEVGRGGLDYRVKEHLLSHIAHQMEISGSFQLGESEFYATVTDFFERRGLVTPRDLKTFVDTNLIKRGVLNQFGGKIGFRFACFFEYFVAKYMKEHGDFYEIVIHEDRYLGYVNEIDYLTGLDRTNKALVQLISERVEKAYEVFRESAWHDPGLSDQIKEFEDAAAENVAENGSHARALENLREARLDDEDRDALMDVLAQPTVDPEQAVNRQYPALIESKLLQGVVLLSLTLRNCELIDDKGFKTAKLRLISDMFSAFLQSVLARVDEDLQGFDEKRLHEIAAKLPPDMRPKMEPSAVETIRVEVRAILRRLIPMAMTELVLYSLGTSSLEVPLRELIGDENVPLESRLVCALLYSDLHLEGFPEKLERMARQIQGRQPYRDLLFNKLMAYYMLETLPQHQLAGVENTLAGMLAQGSGYSQNEKAFFVTKLKRAQRTNTNQNSDGLQ